MAIIAGADDGRLVDLYGRRTVDNHFSEFPIFIFATGERCGSTLLQRLLCTHPDVFIWGEQRGALNHLVEFYKTAFVHASENSHIGDLYLQNGDKEFIANLSPGRASSQNSLRTCIRTFYGGYAKRWGCKEVRCGTTVAEVISDIFPNAKFIFLTRNVASCLSSLMHWNYDENLCEEVLNRWLTLSEEIQGTEHTKSCYKLIRYEDFINDTTSSTRDICEFLDLETERIDMTVLNTRVADHANMESISSPSPRPMLPLSNSIELLLGSPRVKSALSKFGY